MSTRLSKVSLVIEWAPNMVVAYDRMGALLAKADSISGLRSHVSGDAILVLSRRSTYLKLSRLPNAKSADIGSVVRVQSANLFPSVQGVLANGFQLTEDVDQEGRLAVLAAAPVELLDDLYSEAIKVGIRVQGAIAASFGSPLVCTTLGVETAAVIEATTEGIAIDIVVDGHISYTRVAPLGSDVATEIDRTFVAAGHTKGAVVSTPGAPFERPTHASLLTCAQAIAKSLSSFDTAILEPPHIAEKREKNIVNQRARLAALMALAACGVVAVVWDGRDRAEQVFQKGKAEYTNAIRASTKARDAHSSRTAKSAALAKEIRRAFEPAQSASDVLTQIGNQVPNGVWLTGTTFERGKELLLRGTATSNDAVGAYVDAMNQNERFRDVKLAFANQALIETTSVVQFSVTAHVVGNFATVKSKKELGKR